MRLHSIREAASLAFDQLRTERFRTGITILGVVIGVATVMAVSAIIVGIRSSILEEIERAGPRNFVVMRNDVTQIVRVGETPSWVSYPRVTYEEAQRLANLDLVAATVAGLDIDRAVSVPGQEIENLRVMGRDVGWLRFTGGDIIAGNTFLPGDVHASRPVAILTENLATRLFGALEPIGRTVRIAGRPFTVIGIFQPPPNIFAAVEPDYVIVPFTAAMKHLGAANASLTVFVVPQPHVTQDEAIDQVIAAMRMMRGLRPTEENNFAVVRQAEVTETFNRLTLVFFVVMIALSSIGLLVGGVGVIAIMMIAVTERTREIGIRKAVGATRSDILWQFLVEAVALTVIGGALGMGVGGAGAWAVSAATPIPARVPAWAIVAAITMAAVTGILFGIWPAWRAARMDPVAALRHE